MDSPPAECLAAVKLLLREHRNTVAIYKPTAGGLVLVIDDLETAEAITSFLEALDGLEMEGAELDLLHPLFNADAEVPEA